MRKYMLIQMPQAWEPGCCDGCPNYYDKCYGYAIRNNRAPLHLCPLHDAKEAENAGQFAANDQGCQMVFVNSTKAPTGKVFKMFAVEEKP